MANVKITDLPADTAPVDGSAIEMASLSGSTFTSKKMLLSTLAGFVIAKLTSGVSAAAVRLGIGAGTPTHPGYVVGRWYWSTRSAAQAQQASTANQIRFAPFVVVQAMTISDVLSRISGTAAGNLQVAFYAADPTTKLPIGAPMATTSSMSTAASAVVTAALSSPLAVMPGLIWIAVNIDNGTATFMQSLAGNSPEQGFLTGAATAANLGSGVAQAPVVYVNQAFGTWPTLTSGSTSEMVGTSPVIGFRVSAIA